MPVVGWGGTVPNQPGAARREDALPKIAWGNPAVSPREATRPDVRTDVAAEPVPVPEFDSPVRTQTAELAPVPDVLRMMASFARRDGRVDLATAPTAVVETTGDEEMPRPVNHPSEDSRPVPPAAAPRQAARAVETPQVQDQSESIPFGVRPRHVQPQQAPADLAEPSTPNQDSAPKSAPKKGPENAAESFALPERMSEPAVEGTIRNAPSRTVASDTPAFPSTTTVERGVSDAGQVRQTAEPPSNAGSSAGALERMMAAAAKAAESTSRTQVISVRLDGPEGIDLRFVHRKGETQMSMRSENADIAQRLRTDLPELQQSLGSRGFQFEPESRERHPQQQQQQQRTFEEMNQQQEHRRSRHRPEEEPGQQDD